MPSFLDDSGILEKSCPRCKGDLQWWHSDGDLLGNPSIYAYRCVDCGYSETEKPPGWKESREKKMKTKVTDEVLHRLYEKIVLLPYEKWTLDGSNVEAAGVNIGMGRGRQIFLDICGEKGITPPVDSLDKWKKLYEKIHTRLLHDKDLEDNAGVINAAEEAIALIDKELKDVQ